MKKRRGFVQAAILHLLKEESMHGYQIMKELEERSSGAYSASAGTIYPALQELLDQELIELNTESTKKIYSLTETGEERLMEVAKHHEIDDFWQEWEERMRWRNSEEFTLLKTALKKWDKELRITMKQARGDTERVRELITFIDKITDQLQKDDKRKK